jgi:hypothetical protein
MVGTALFAAIATTAALLPGAPASSTPRDQASTAGGTSAASTVALAAAGQGDITSRVRGEFGRNGTVRGTFDVHRFIFKRGDQFAAGVLHATLRRGNGTLVGRVNREINIPLRNAAASAPGAAAAGAPCQILDLVLGPLDLNLLGLRVHLNRVVLHIDADPGAGALLGNLLCAVAGLLDRTGLLSQLRLSNILNRILSLLRL